MQQKEAKRETRICALLADRRIPYDDPIHKMVNRFTSPILDWQAYNAVQASNLS